MKALQRSGLAIALLATASTGMAQKSEPQKKLYCWDEGGRRVCGDALPASALDKARDALAGSDGADWGRALSAEGWLHVAAAGICARVASAPGALPLPSTLVAGPGAAAREHPLAAVREALQATGLKTKREVVELGLRTLLRLKQQQQIKTLRGKIDWQGDLQRMRTDE